MRMRADVIVITALLSSARPQAGLLAQLRRVAAGGRAARNTRSTMLIIFTLAACLGAAAAADTVSDCVMARVLWGSFVMAT